MSQTKVLVFVAGAALSIGAQALAQNANLDQSRAYANELVADAGTRASLLQGGKNDTTIGFNMPDTRLRFWGNVWDKALTYKIQGDFGGAGGDRGSFELQ